MARLGGQLTLFYYLFIVFTFFATPFFAKTAAPVVVVVAARELHREQALARAQQRWNQRIYYLDNSHIDPELALLDPFDPNVPWRLSPTPTMPRESHRFASPSQTSVPSRTKSAPLNRITSFPGEYEDFSPLHRRYIEKRAVCPIVTQTTVFVYFSSGAHTPFSTTTVVGPRSTGIPGDDDPDGALHTVDTVGIPTTVATATTTGPTNGGGNNNGNGGHGVNAALLAGIFSIVALIILAFILTACYCYRKRKARKLAAVGQVDEKKDAPTIVREMGSKGFATLGSSMPASPNRGAFLHPGTMIDKALAVWERTRNKRSSIHSKASDDSELQDWNVMNGGRSRRSVRWSELPPSSMQRGSGLTGTRSDKTFPTMTSDPMGAARVEEASTPLHVPAASPSLLDFRFPNQPTNAPSGSESSHSLPSPNPAISSAQAPILYETGPSVLYATGPDVLYETSPSRPDSSTSSYALPPPTEALPAIPINVRPLSKSPIRPNFTGATSATTSISPRQAPAMTAISVSPTIFKQTADVRQPLPRSVSPPRRDSREGALSPSAWIAGFGLTPVSQPGPGQGVGKSSGTAEDPFADPSSSSGRGAGSNSNAVAGPSGSSSIPFPREPPKILPVRRLPGREEMSPERQTREKERQRESKRIVQLAMAWPGRPVSEESFSVDTHEVLEMHEDIASKLSQTPTSEGSHPPVSIRPEYIRKDSNAATTETHQTQFSAKSYPYAGLIALHAPTARPLSASSKSRSQISFGHLSSSAETDYGNPFEDQSERASGAVSFSSSQYLYGYANSNLDDESVRGRSLRSSRRSSMSALSVDPITSPGLQRNPSWGFGPSGRAGARASLAPTSKAEAAQRAAALIQLTSGVRRDRSVPTRSPTPPSQPFDSESTMRGRPGRESGTVGGIIIEEFGRRSRSVERTLTPATSDPATPTGMAFRPPPSPNQTARSVSTARRRFSIRP